MSARTLTKRKRKHAIRERSLAAAIGWSIVVAAALGLAIFAAELALPGTPLHNFWDLVVVNGQVAPDNPLIAQFLNQVRMLDILGVSFACVMGGGITLGRLAPQGRTRRATLWAAAMTAAGIMIGCVLLALTFQLVQQHGHLFPGQVDGLLFLTQLGWTIVWAAAFAGGAVIGLGWRDARRRKSHPAGAPISSGN